ncbi:MAG: hypothetical protein M1820_005014 [Bogoriella megaspora]|nr:MAG: hypothetical protein M1820_005014 [Bogoriella megaspora]
MRSYSFISVFFLALIHSFAIGLIVPLSESEVGRMKRSLNTQTQEELASLICSNSTIVEPTDAKYITETERYMQNINPQVQLSVRPGCEGDVAKIVQYANNHNISFYAVNRGHALTTTVGLFTGIEIDLKEFNKLHINSNNVTAHFQGGVYSYQAINDLWKQGFVTGKICGSAKIVYVSLTLNLAATGTCSCVGVLGPALGGGHGLQQGKHGLTADHLVSLNLVLANGSAIQVNENSHPDLWWGMRGAGHNFGIITSFETKIWPDNFKNYYVKTYQFGGSSLDALIEQVNKFQGNGTLDPTWLGSFGLYTMNNTLSETKFQFRPVSDLQQATITWVFLYDGTKASAEPALKPFDDLQPLSVSELNIPYTLLNDQIGGAVNGSLCEPNKTHVIGTANLQTYNATAMRAIYDLYNQKIGQHPELGGTRVLVEGYSVQGVRSVDHDASAYPFRDDYILTYFDVKLNSSDDPLIDFATEWRNQTVDLWNAGQPQRPATTYVNYAAGYESLEARYGFESWRLDRLRQLKGKYDPTNRFAWYNPIIPPNTAY